MKTVFFSVTLLALMASCNNQSSVTPTQSPRQQVAYQKGVRLAGSTSDLKVVQVTDSRCPINARCVTAGSVKVRFEASADGTTQLVDVELAAYPEKPVETRFTVNGQIYQLTLHEVLPYPEVGKEIKPEAYSVQVSVVEQ